jgi:hypothetical protein
MPKPSFSGTNPDLPAPACTDSHTANVDPTGNDRRRAARGISHAADVERQTERESILWAAFMSVYANVVGHFSCSEATEPTKKADEANGTVLQSLQRCPNRLSQLVSAARTVDRRGARLPSRRGRGWATRVAATTQMSSRAPLGASSPSTRSHSCCAVPEKPSTTRHSCATPSRPARSSGSISPSVYSMK